MAIGRCLAFLPTAHLLFLSIALGAVLCLFNWCRIRGEAGDRVTQQQPGLHVVLRARAGGPPFSTMAEGHAAAANRQHPARRAGVLTASHAGMEICQKLALARLLAACEVADRVGGPGR